MDTLTPVQLQRFYARVPDLPDDVCWPWQGHLQQYGYGTFSIWIPETKKARKVMAHRLMYELSMGRISDGLQIDHECHNRDRACAPTKAGCAHRACVNPAHLQAVTGTENRRNSGRTNFDIQKAKTECDHGHPFDEANTYHWRGQRACRACGAANQQAIRDRRKAAAG